MEHHRVRIGGIYCWCWKALAKNTYSSASEVCAKKAVSLRNIFDLPMLVLLKIPYLEAPNGKLRSQAPYTQ